MKYMLMMNAMTMGDVYGGASGWENKDIQAHIVFMKSLSKSLGESGELVSTEGLSLPDQARLVRAGTNGVPDTDGVFPESKEFLAGYWIVDVDTPNEPTPSRPARPRRRDPRVYRSTCQSKCGRSSADRPRSLCNGDTVTQRSWNSTDEHLLRELAPQVLGAVIRRFHDFASAEDAVQEALIAAFLQWPAEGLPENPRGWLIQVASRRMMDQLRSDIARQRRETTMASEVESESAGVEVGMEHDDTLILLFMCCHPALTVSSAIALTLRAVGGLTTAEIAHAFLVPESTMAQRISRAKQSIKTSRVPFALPTRQEQAQRFRTVLHVLYLIFSEGYTSSGRSAIAAA